MREDRLNTAIRLQRRFERETLCGATTDVCADEFEVAHFCATQQASQLHDVFVGVAIEIGQQLRISRDAEGRDLGDHGLTQAPGQFVAVHSSRSERRPTEFREGFEGAHESCVFAARVHVGCELSTVEDQNYQHSCRCGGTRLSILSTPGVNRHSFTH